MRKTFAFVVLAAVVWLPSLQYFYQPDLAGMRALQEPKLEAALAHASSPERQAMRAVNPEWDFMNRTFSVLAFANLALGQAQDRPRDERYLLAIDAIIEDTLATESADEMTFLMSYARSGPFVDREARSLFLDGEIALMLAARQLVQRDPAKTALLRERTARIARTMARSPSFSGESYPNECWTFCNTTALAALAASDRVLGEDHGELSRAWLTYAKAHLVDAKTGMLVSSYTYDGHVLDGPEGSSIWMNAHNLRLIDDAFAKDQYTRARRELGRTVLGFSYAREWPEGANARPDVDSGPIVPFFEASAGSSGMAFLGASAFGDGAYLNGLVTSLNFAAFPVSNGKTLHYQASNEVGDAVLLYALSFGPLHARIRETPGRTALRTEGEGQ